MHPLSDLIPLGSMVRLCFDECINRLTLDSKKGRSCTAWCHDVKRAFNMVCHWARLRVLIWRKAAFFRSIISQVLVDDISFSKFGSMVQVWRQQKTFARPINQQKHYSDPLSKQEFANFLEESDGCQYAAYCGQTPRCWIDAFAAFYTEREQNDERKSSNKGVESGLACEEKRQGCHQLWW